MKALLMTLIAATAALSLDAADAHGSTKPAHGGIVKIVGETSFEFVALENGAEVYLKEEDEELDTAQMTGKLTVTHEGGKSEAALQPAGGNKLTATNIKLPSGAKVSVSVTCADQMKLGATFTMK